ncbi:hypothetical protein ACFL2Q_18560 [Thermodesulfobacteriota bacterium]
MMIAGGPETRHIVVGAEKETIVDLPGFSQVGDDINIEFATSIREVPHVEHPIYVSELDNLTKRPLICNSTLIFIDPNAPIPSQPGVLAKQYVWSSKRRPGIILSLKGMSAAWPALKNKFGRKTVARYLVLHGRNKTWTKLLRFRDRVRGRIARIPGARSAYYRLSGLRNTMEFVQLKARLRSVKPEKKVFPFDDHTTHM